MDTLKILKQVDEINAAAAKIPEQQQAAKTITPGDLITYLKSFRDFLIPALTFLKLFTSAATDAKIDGFIAVLQSL